MIATRYGRSLRGIRGIIGRSPHYLTSTEGFTPFLETGLSKDTRNHGTPVTFSIVRNNQTDSKVTNETSEPTLEIARAMGTGYTTMDNSSLMLLASLESPAIEEARAEVLRRHIMSVDSVDYTTAKGTFKEIEASNRDGLSFLFLPHKLGLGVAGLATVSSYFLVFDLSLAEWFNQHYVTADVPEPKDLQTVLEVGSWTWNWMEPPLGQISFALLCLQFARAQMQNMGIRPYTDKVLQRRAESLSSKYPQYDRKIVEAFSKCDLLYSD